jgi:CHC2 zinc finger
MAKDFRQEAAQDEASRKAYIEWLQQRVEVIHQRITAHDILRHGGVELRTDGEEQFSCPFHGADNTPSARVYPEGARSRSHAWCFVCQERWDVIALWKKFNPGADDKTFSRVVKELEQAFNITTPEMPTEATLSAKHVDVSLVSFDALYEAAEGRLRGAREAYQHLDDLTGYLSAGQVIDKVRHQVDTQQMPPLKGEEILRKLLARIAQKVRSCPVG